MNQISRTTLLEELYQTSSKKDLIERFNTDISITKGTKSQRYTHLLETIIFYSHAIIFGHGVQTAHNYRQSFMTTAKKNKHLGLDDKAIKKAFGFLNRTEKNEFVEKEAPTKAKEPIKEEPKECIAKDEIRRLKAQLDDKSYELSRGQKVEDKEIFIKVALLALSTGSRLKEITEDLKVSSKKGVTYFDDGKTIKEGVILELDIKTVQSYLKAIRSHYEGKKGDIGTGIRKSILRLEIPFKGNHTTRSIKNKRTGQIKIVEYKDISTSLNHLNAIYSKCLPTKDKA